SRLAGQPTEVRDRVRTGPHAYRCAGLTFPVTVTVLMASTFWPDWSWIIAMTWKIPVVSSTGRWLGGFTSLCALRRKAHGHEREVAAMAALSLWDALAWNELQAALHEDIRRLPQEYGVPI